MTAGVVPCTSAVFAELSTDILRAGKALRFRARGASMAPQVCDGDVLLVRPVAPAAIRTGDVLLCRCPAGRIVVHRVVRRLAGLAGTGFLVQGDAAAWPDEPVLEAQVYGRVAAIERGGVRIDLERPMLRLLGRLVALRARLNLGAGRPYRLAARLVRRLPILSRHLP